MHPDQANSSQGFPPAPLGSRQAVSQGWNSSSSTELVFYLETAVGCVRLELFNNYTTTKCPEQTGFAAALFIMQAELSLIR